MKTLTAQQVLDKMTFEGVAELRLTIPAGLSVGSCAGNRYSVHSACYLNDWLGMLHIPCRVFVGRVDRLRKRYDVYFIGPDGCTWHGIAYSGHSMNCRCTRTSEKA